MDALPLPATPGEVTPTWLTAAFQQAGLLRQGTVVSATWERIGEEQGFTGALARFQLGYDAAGSAEAAPPSLVAKFPTAPRSAPSDYRERQQRDPLASQQHYARCAREVRFYQEVAPFGPAPVPKMYYGAADEASGRVVLLLEDMRAARVGNVLRGCFPTEAALALRALAPLHARWWGRSCLDALPWLPSWAGDPQARQERYTRQVGLFLARFGQQLPTPVVEIVDRLRYGYAAVLTRLADAPPTLLHADLHLDNVLFQPPESAQKVTVLDWQNVSSGPSVVDVAQFLFGSLAVEQRRAAERGLLLEYHARLVVQGVSGYTLDDLREQCRFALLRLLAGTVGWLSSVNLAAVTGRERALALAALGDGRLIAALQDYEVADVLAG